MIFVRVNHIWSLASAADQGRYLVGGRRCPPHCQPVRCLLLHSRKCMHAVLSRMLPHHVSCMYSACSCALVQFLFSRNFATMAVYLPKVPRGRGPCCRAARRPALRPRSQDLRPGASASIHLLPGQRASASGHSTTCMAVAVADAHSTFRVNWKKHAGSR